MEASLRVKNVLLPSLRQSASNWVDGGGWKEKAKFGPVCCFTKWLTEALGRAGNDEDGPAGIHGPNR